MLLRTIHIGAFRGLQNALLRDLGRVNLFVGKTNSGKTSVLEAVYILSRPLDPVTWLHTANRREPSPLAALTSSSVDRLKYLFPSTALEEFGPVSLCAEGSCEVRTVSAVARELRGLRPTIRSVVEEEDGEPTEVAAEVERAGVEIQVQATAQHQQPSLFDEPLARTFEVWEREPVFGRKKSSVLSFPARVVTPYDHWLRSPSPQAFSEATLEGYSGEILDLIQKFEPSIVDLRLLATQREPSLYLRDAKNGLLPLSSFGDGLRRIIAIALALPRAKNGILLIDEIETGLHVHLLGKVYSWLVQACHSQNVQLFATTHSLEALDALLEADTTADEDTVAFNLDDSQVRRFGENQLRRLRTERGLDVR